MPRPSIAVVGGGQLARMMQQAAIGLQVDLHALVESADGATAQVVPDATVGAAGDPAALRALAARSDVLTFEHEHVPNEVLHDLRESGHAVEPGPEALIAAQDKIVMRRRLSELGVPVPAWREATAPEHLLEFAAEYGWPIVAKTPRGGYDGKGVAVLTDAQDAAALTWPLDPEHPILLEQHVPFQRELAALLARSPRGEIRTWPVVETVQRGGVCAEVTSPAPDLRPSEARAAEGIARMVAEGLGVTGVLAVELFEIDGDLLVNELAMRPHNSGHVTIDAHVTSQFEQHLRAVLDLPLGSTRQRAPWGVMVNLLGSELDEPTEAYDEVMRRFPEAKIHLYGKEVRPGRKLGHVTVAGEDLAAVRTAARGAVALLSGREDSTAPAHQADRTDRRNA
ncbi:5-(carboxyamino)imidazole ribonucleotide synthase [Serinibacter salmoneus]|uniref:N5-carboxyaminoimidazole ribonucleotide synthase n=1 Tax=Serinibacter salmoneus TaxID=556530 RepID=A0A2A9D1X2_9MICO|nr:5-(carboxyamino)imidazole ribonucleotide synthase [Serinibacter salmoneus]PFG20371.1 5-(carboxyamino)imidazole ribonucleotide synthase [Serinibacter salmoneus]